VKVWKVLLDALSRRVEQSCLRRDAFLERVISAELPLLEKEISTPNSPEAQKCIADHLRLLPSKPLTLHLTPPTIKRLDGICHEKRLVRDAFINRLILCLVAPRKLLNVIFTTDDYQEDVGEQWEENPGERHQWQILRMAPDLITEPFAFVRMCLDIDNERNGLSKRTGTTFYNAYIPQNLFGNPDKSSEQGKSGAPNVLGLNVYLPDVLVPGHPSQKALDADLGLELDDLQKRSKKR